MHDPLEWKRKDPGVKTFPPGLTVVTALSLPLLLFWILVPAAPACAGGSRTYQAGGLEGYPPAASSARQKNTGMWKDRQGTNYQSAPPKESWQIPWKKEQENQDRAWDALDSMTIEVYPRRPYPPFRERDIDH